MKIVLDIAQTLEFKQTTVDSKKKDDQFLTFCDWNMISCKVNQNIEKVKQVFFLEFACTLLKPTSVYQPSSSK